MNKDETCERLADALVVLSMTIRANKGTPLDWSLTLKNILYLVERARIADEALAEISAAKRGGERQHWTGW